MPITSFEIVSVPVSDPVAARRFYQDVLGFTLLRDEPMGPGQRWIQLAPPGCATTITLVTWFERMRPGGLQGVMLNVQDLDAEHARLRASGLPLTDVREEPWGRYATFSDPDGNGWILREPPTGR
jgi:catechol 2,3-dioxygenase-like lactoylglutathione lyase family enzyme